MPADGLAQAAAQARALRDQDARPLEEVLRIGRLLKPHLDERLECLAGAGVEGAGMSEVRRAAIRQVLAEVREVGTEGLQVHPKGTRASSAARDLARLAEEFYPADWLRASNRRSVVRVGTRMILWRLGAVCMALLGVAVAAVGVLGSLDVLITIGWPVEGLGAWLVVAAGVVLALIGIVAGAVLLRMFYRIWQALNDEILGAYWPFGGGLFSVSRGAARQEEWYGLLVHELFHRFEHVIGSLKPTEQEFRTRRGGRKKDAWFHPYAASKNITSYEVLTQAYQAMTFGVRCPESNQFDPDLQPDPEHQAFVLGILACL